MMNRSTLLTRVLSWRLLLLCGVLGLMPQVKASHLVGGDLGYEYMGETAPGSGMFRYKLKMRMYLNCGSSSNYPQMIQWLGGANIPLRVGVYNEDPNNPDAPKQLYTIAFVYLLSYGVVTPDVPDSCIVGDGQCMEESLFEGQVDVPASIGGYHLYFQGNARNAAILNLNDPGNTGFGIYSFIPPTAIVNSSPVFSGVPVPFICISETTSFSNAAVDADGDSLVFSFEEPYDSQDDGTGIIDPPGVLNWPIAPVIYANSDYFDTQPFGPGGTAIIDPETGAAQYSATMIGNWAVAVEVKEYRDGQFIGRIKSDMQLLSLPCTNNEAPAPLGGSLVTAYEVDAGDTLCFPMTFVDADGDVVHFDANGIIFDGGVFDPPASINGALLGDSILTVNFCWPTVCEQGSPDPYTFSVVAYDQACPPGIYTATITVDVNPGGEQLVITGPGVACAGQSVSTYCAEGQGTDFVWNVSGGNVISPTNEPCVTVEWVNPGIGNVAVTSDVGDCVFTNDQPVNIVPPPEALFSVDLDTTCLGVKAHVYDIQPQGATQQWYINGDPSSISSNGTTLPMAFSSSSDIMLVATDQYGCIDSTSQSFTIGSYQEEVHFYIPNVFSPNGDNKNDRFVVASDQDVSECVIMHIYDRWGKLVFETDNGELGWNGRRDGDDAAQSSYYYVITVGDETFHGYVDLLR